VTRARSIACSNKKRVSPPWGFVCLVVPRPALFDIERRPYHSQRSHLHTHSIRRPQL
jgi:hypothetical protein